MNEIKILTPVYTKTLRINYQYLAFLYHQKFKNKIKRLKQLEKITKDNSKQSNQHYSS